MRSPALRAVLLAAVVLLLMGIARAQAPSVSFPGPIPTPAQGGSMENQSPPVAPAVEGRGIWIEMKTLPASAEGIRKVVRRLARCNLNFLLLEVTYEGSTLYPGPFQEPRFRGIDPLAIAIDEAHRENIELHAWFWALKQGRWREGDPHPGGPVLAAHPEWTAINQMGVPVSPGASYYWLCPSRPASRRHLIDQCQSVARNYAIDGLHLDYIRCDRTIVKGAPPPYCACEACREAFQRAGGADIMRIAPYTPEFRAWMLWRENLVSTLVDEVSAHVRAVRPGIIVSAAVYPDPLEARRFFGQNWTLWLANRSIDFVTPMLYRDQTDTFVRRMRHYIEDGITSIGVVLPGVGVNEIQNRIFSHDVLIEQVRAARDQGMLGSVLFSFSVMTPYFEQFLIDKVFVKPARVPFRNEVDAMNRLMAQAQALVADGSSPFSFRQANWLLARARELEAVLRYRDQAPPPAVATDVPFIVPARYQPTPVVSLPRMPAPAIDGALSDAAWKKVPAVRLSLRESSARADSIALARLGTDGRSIFVGVECHDADLAGTVARVRRHARQPWTEDHVAVFLDPGASRSQYLVLKLGLLGAASLEKVPSGKKRPPGVGTPESVPDDVPWSGRVRRVARGWTAEMRIPIESLMALHPGVRTLGLNIARLHHPGPTAHYDEWVTSYGSPFDPLRFATVEIPR